MDQEPIIAALQTGLTNARTEGYNRIIKHVGRIAFRSSATPTTNTAEYGGPAPADRGRSHLNPASTNATANCEESKKLDPCSPH